MRMIWMGMGSRMANDSFESSLWNLMGTKNPHEIRFIQESIRVFFRDDHFYSLDNRRLEVFRRAGIDIPVRLARFDEIEAET